MAAPSKSGIMRAFALSTLLLMALTSAGYSQDHEPGENANTEAAKSDAQAARARAERKKQERLDAEYKAALSKQKSSAAAPSDPWADVRPAASPPAKHQ